MSSRVSELSPRAKKEILAQIHAQVGADQYEQLVNQYGEESLIERVLVMMETSPSSDPASRKLGRVGGLLTGVFLGLIAGVLFWVTGWLLNALFSVPLKYSLSALTSGAIITIPTSMLVVWWRKGEGQPFDFRAVFRWYALGSFVGGLIGIGRWMFNYEESLMGLLNPFWNSFNETWGPGILGFAVIIGAILWIVSLGRITGAYDFLLTVIMLPLLFIWAIGFVLAGLADAPLWNNTFVSIINQNFAAAAWIAPISLGGLLGFCWPPHVPATG